MKFKKNDLLSLDNFIEECLYNKKFGYYMKNDPFGEKGDFITAPNISILFSEMIAVWVISFWESLDCPKNFNLVELGAGNGEMIRIILDTFTKFPEFKNCCNIKILEKSNHLRKIQENALPIKQFIKKNKMWHEKHVKFIDQIKAEFLDIPSNIQKLENKIKFKISSNQEFIEYSPLTIDYLKIITNKININNGGILIIDYGYTNREMKNTLQAVSKHKYTNILKNFGKLDITYNLNFKLISQLIKKMGSFSQKITTQKKFLTRLGILERAEILSNNVSFSKKADIYFRLRRLIDDKQMGNLFKVLFVTNKKNKFKLGFESD